MSCKHYLIILFILLVTSCSNEGDPPQAQKAAETPESGIELVPGSDQDTAQTEAREAIISTEELTTNIADLQESETLSLREPDAAPVDLAIDSRLTDRSGNVTIKSTTQTAAGTYQLTAVVGQDGGFGRLRTPTTTYRITVRNGRMLLTDLNGPGNKIVPGAKDDYKTPSQAGRTANLLTADDVETTIPSAEASPPVAGMATVDLLVLYPPELETAYPGTLLDSYLALLVELANTSYENSNVNMRLRLVHKELIDQDPEQTLEETLDAMTESQWARWPNPSAPLPPFEGVAAIRDEHGADLVAFIRPYVIDNDGYYCGLAWLLGGSGSGSFAGDDTWAYATVNVGSDEWDDNRDNYTYYCSDLTMTHELGHNMGLAHDRANAVGSNPAYYYSYGYGVSGKFGTVMSYINPDVEYFSNPNVTCYQTDTETLACGITETDTENAANNALSLNNSASQIAAFKQSQYSGDIDDDGDITLKDSLKSLKIISNESPDGTIDKREDINGDGRIGLEEAIYILQQQ